jgi:hypothetical protein
MVGASIYIMVKNTVDVYVPDQIVPVIQGVG